MQPLHTPKDGAVMKVRALEPADLEAVAERVQARLAHDARRNRLINPDFSADVYMTALSNATDQTWVAVDAGRLVGHLFGALLENTEHSRGVWIGPDGVSFDDHTVLDALYRQAGATWIARGALEHYVWVFDDEVDTAAWYDLGFVRNHVRGVIELATPSRQAPPSGYTFRRENRVDLALAVELDRLVDDDQSEPSSTDELAGIEEWRELLEDDEVHHYVVEFDGRGVAQCVTYPLDVRRGTFDQTLHISAVAVRPEYEHRGIARAMIDRALRDAYDAGLLYAETNWRANNLRAAEFWTRYGLRPTYVRLRRTVTSL
jgi:ribosomal protein S18 acetylase RimI-like enzyme